MSRVAPAFDPAQFHADGMPAGDLINLDVGAILAHKPEVAAALGQVTTALNDTCKISRRTSELIPEELQREVRVAPWETAGVVAG